MEENYDFLMESYLELKKYMLEWYKTIIGSNI
jgi:hypothetical protein